MFYNDEDTESNEIKHEQLDIKNEIINDPQSSEKEEKLNAIKKGKGINKYFYKCKECDYFTTHSERRLNEHLYRTHDIREEVTPYECYNCGELFANKFRLSFHIKKELNILKQFKCSKCEYSTFYASHLRRHFINKHTADEEIEWFKCTECDHKTKSKSELKKHQGKHSPKKKFKCNDCIYSSRFKRSLEDHIRRKHQTEEDIEMFHCVKCDYNTKTKFNLSRHMRTSHFGNKNDMKKYKCDECEFYTVHKTNLRMHIIRKHTPDKQSVYYNCKKCDFRTKDPFSLTNHKQIHLDGCFPCDRCEYKGKTKDQLRNHLDWNHLKRNAYKCKECPYTTHKSTTLRSHVKCKHTPENEIQYFYCEHCTYKAKLKYALRNHIRQVHLKDQLSKLQCPDCLYSTVYKRHFEKHVMGKHTPEDKKKYFYCDKCDYKSIRANDIKKHDYVGHTHPDLIKWHKCPYCKTKMKLKPAMTKHIKSQHPEKMEK